MAVTVSLQLAPGPATSPVADARRPSVTLHHKSTGHQEAAATDQSRHIRRARRSWLGWATRRLLKGCKETGSGRPTLATRSRLPHRWVSASAEAGGWRTWRLRGARLPGVR